MIVTIDGPAGAGKSTVARGLAERLGFEFLDTGAMYRAVALAAMQQGVDPDDEANLPAFLATLRIVVDGPRVTLNDEDVSALVRTPEVTAHVRNFSDRGVVRAFLVQCQREIARGKDLVTEGRDQGTVVFPHAECKFYLTAGDEVRARRRQVDFARQGKSVPLDRVLAEQRDRDRRDQERTIAPLRRAADAISIDTSDLDANATIDLLERHVRERRKYSHH